MSCDAASCPTGDCPGCANGETWCQDPRCHPYCANCRPPPYHTASVNIALIALAAALALGAFVFLLAALKPSMRPGLRYVPDNGAEVGAFLAKI